MSTFVEIEEIPEDFPKDYSYEINSGEILVKEIHDEDSANEWLKSNSQNSGTTWTVNRTYDSTGSKVIFKKEWKCHHNVQKVKGKEQKKSSKNLNCPGKIRLTVYKMRKRIKSKRTYAADFPCCLQVNFSHNHLLHSAAILRYRKMSEETRETLISLFMKGHTASTARESLKLDVYLQFPDEYYERRGDCYYVPTLSRVQHLLNNTFQNTYGAKDGENMETDLQRMLQQYNTSVSGGNAIFQKFGSHSFVAICTPVMSRAHKFLLQAAEMILVDASGNVDKQGHRIYFFITPTPAGGVPLGCIITDVEKQDLFVHALEGLKSVLPEECFYNKGYPAVIMTDDDLKERGPLKTVWESSVLLLCHFHVLKAMWTWLLLSNHHIAKTDRQEMYFKFKQMVYAQTQEKLEDCLTDIQDSYEEKYPNFVQHVNQLYERKEFWANVYRENLPIRGNNTNNYVETVFRILKDCVLERVKAFNLTHLVDFILTKYDGYMERRLVDFAHGRYSNAQIRKYLPKCPQNFNFNLIEKTGNDLDCFKVPSHSEPGKMHTVDSKHGFCTCYRGSTGAICWHLSAVLIHFCLSDNVFTASRHAQKLMFEVATGKKPPPGWLLPLQATSIEENDDTTDNVTDTTASMSVEQSNTKLQQTSMETETHNLPSLTEEEKVELKDIFERINACATENPVVFVPAVKKMLKNYKEYVKTDNSLETALHMFGRYTGPAAMNNINERYGDMISVQPGSRARRREPLGGKRRQHAGRPAGIKKVKDLINHDYHFWKNAHKESKSST